MGMARNDLECLQSCSVVPEGMQCCSACPAKQYFTLSRLSKGRSGPDSNQEQDEPPQEAFHGMRLAAKMTAEMGWTEAEGLGRSEHDLPSDQSMCSSQAEQRWVRDWHKSAPKRAATRSLPWHGLSSQDDGEDGMD